MQTVNRVIWPSVPLYGVAPACSTPLRMSVAQYALHSQLYTLRLPAALTRAATTTMKEKPGNPTRAPPAPVVVATHSARLYHVLLFPVQTML